TPPEEWELFVPYPKLARGSYPDVRLPSINAAIEKAKMGGGKPNVPVGNQGGKKDGGGIFRPGGEGRGKLAENDKDKGKDQDKGNPADNVLEAMLVRFMDVDVTPGYAYEYRIQVKVANPNYGRFKEVSQPDHAKTKDLLSDPSLVTFKDGDKETSIVKVPTN